MRLMDVIGTTDPDANALIRRMSVSPQGNRQWLINRLFRDLKRDGVYSKLDAFWVLAAHDAQAARLNWKGNSAFDLTAVNSPTFTTDRGYAGNGTTSYLNTGWNPSANGVNFTLFGNSFGAWVVGGTDANNSSAATIGSADASNQTRLLPRISNGNCRVSDNSIGTVDITIGSPTRLGLNVADRAANATTISHYRNGALVNTGALSSAGVPSAVFFIGAHNGNGTPSMFIDNTLVFAFAGASLAAAAQTAIYDAFSAYKTAVGA